MSDDQTPETAPEWSDSDQRWFDTLTGQRAATTDDPSPEVVGALLMREAYLREQAPDAAMTQALAPMLTDEARRARKADLIQHLQAQGLMDAPGPTTAAATAPMPASRPAQAPAPAAPRPGKPWWQFWGSAQGPGSQLAWPRTAGAFAVVALVLVTGRWALSPDYPVPPDEVITRGERAVIARTDPDPRRAAEGLAQRLKAGGVRAAVYQIKKVYLVDVTVLAKDLPDVEAALTREGLPAKPDDYRVEFRAP